MGQFMDYRRPGRDDWKYTYKGSELVEAAKKKLEELTGQFVKAQEKLKVCVDVAATLYKDKPTQEARELVEQLGPEMESCEVWLHEFQRTPDREFILSMSDVTYFNLHRQVA